MLSAIQAFFEALAHFFRWRAIESEISSRRILIDELKNIEKESDELEARIDSLRANNSDLNADKLRQRFARRSNLITNLSAELSLSQKESASTNSEGQIHPTTQ